MTAPYHTRLTSLAAALSLLIAVACGRSERPQVPATSSTDASNTSPPAPPAVGRDLRALRWIEGTWRGSGETQAPFYERYRLADDSTLVVESFSDSTLSRVTETTQFQLREGRLTSAPASGQLAGRTPRWYASVLTPDSVRFVPLVVARNNFVWHRGSTPDSWTAVLSSAASASRPSRTVTYTMRRWK